MDGGWFFSFPSSLSLELVEVLLVYVCNAQKLALGLEGTPNPTYEEIDAAVTATKYTGFVSLEYHVDKAGGSPGPEYAELAITKPVVSGVATVGETLTCSEPTVTGGSGGYKFTYTWKLQADDGAVFGSGSEVEVPAEAVGKQGYCEVTALDSAAGLSISKDSNVVGPVEASVKSKARK